MKSLLKFQHNKLCISAGFVEGAGGGRCWRRRLAEAAPLFLEFSNKKQTTRKKTGKCPWIQFSASGICSYKIIVIVTSYTGCLSGRSLDTGETLLDLT